MLMRETASELTLSPEAIDRERGVVLSEKRDRTTYAQKETEDEWAFVEPGARFPERLPIGTDETLKAADAAHIRAFYRRAYVPTNAVLIVIGAIDVPQVEAAIRARFGDWSGPPAPAKPEAGPVDLGRHGETDIYLDPALSYTADGWTTLWPAYTGLLTFKHAEGAEGSKIVPGLAEDMPKISADGLTYSLTLRPVLKPSESRT